MKALTNSAKPKLLILTSSFPSGPADETCGYIRDFARSLSLEFEVQVLAPPDTNAVDWPADYFTLARSASLFPDSIDMFQATRDFNGLAVNNIGAWLAFICSFSLYFIKAIRLAARSDVVCSQWLVPSGLVGALIARLTGRPHVVVEHSGALHLLSRMRSGRLIARFIVSSAECVVVVSKDLKQKLVTLCDDASSKTEVIPMGVRVRESQDKSARAADRLPVARRAPAESNKSMILFIGRLTEVKGTDVLLRAMSDVESARLVIAGDGEQRPYLEALASALKVDATFLGQVDARRRNQLLAECVALVIPSRILPDGRTEGTPVVCLEAMAAGLAVVASRVGGLAEVIIDGNNGLLFEPENHRMLAEKIKRVLDDLALYQALSRNARLTAADYSWAGIGARFSKIINDARRNDPINYDAVNETLDCRINS